MKGNKIIILITIVLAISILSTGCGKKSLDKSLDDNVSIIDEYDEEDDNEIIDWPADKMRPLPRPEAEVLLVNESPEIGAVTVKVNFPDFKAVLDYVEQVKKLGYVQHTLVEGGKFYSFGGALRNDNSVIDLDNNGYDNSTIISLTRDTDYTKQYFEEEPDADIEMDEDMTDEFPWPMDQMDGFPKLQGKIERVDINNDSVYIELDYVEKYDLVSYIETAKNLGFDFMTNQKEVKNTISFIGENDKEQTIYLVWDNRKVSINFIKKK